MTLIADDLPGSNQFTGRIQAGFSNTPLQTRLFKHNNMPRRRTVAG
jgi:hypothetical protein